MSYKYFLFDWDGSLADTLPIWFEAFMKIFAKHGVSVTNEVISREVLGDWSAPERLGVVDTDLFFADLESEVAGKLDKVKLNPGVLEILSLIKKAGGKIAVVTASRKRWVKRALRGNGLRDLVDVFLGKDDVEFVKPDPESLLKALRLMGGNVNKAIMIGDNGKDVVAGKAAGMDTGLYFPKRYEEFYSREVQLNWGATYIFEDFGDLKNTL